MLLFYGQLKQQHFMSPQTPINVENIFRDFLSNQTQIQRELFANLALPSQTPQNEKSSLQKMILQKECLLNNLKRALILPS